MKNQRFATYSQYAKNWLVENEIKLKTVYVDNSQYDERFIYLNRIANCSKPKFRVLQLGKDKVKNCIKITFNTERHNKQFLTYFIESKLKLIARQSKGSCHSFIDQNIIAEVLSGCWVVENGYYKMNNAVLA
jgi:hypothetical protein